MNLYQFDVNQFGAAFDRLVDSLEEYKNYHLDSHEWLQMRAHANGMIEMLAFMTGFDAEHLSKQALEVVRDRIEGQ